MVETLSDVTWGDTMTHVTRLMPGASIGAVVLEEAGDGTLNGWYSPRWFNCEVVVLSRVKLDITRSLLDVLDTDSVRFPEYRVLEVISNKRSRDVVFYAPFSLDTFMLSHNNWTALKIDSEQRVKWELLADLSRHVSISYSIADNNTVPYAASIGDLRAINSASFAYLPSHIRDVIEDELNELQ